MRILFAGTPAIAVPSLQAIHRKYDVVGVLTNPDRKKGRGKALAMSPVKEAALELDVPVLQFPELKGEARRAVAELKPDLLVTFAFGRIFGPRFLALFPLGGINIHPSLLPKYRGCAPIPAAILAGDKETGISIQDIALEMDSGDIILQKVYPIHEDDTTEDLTLRFSREGAHLVVDALEHIEERTVEKEPQDHSRATYCNSISKEDGLISWDASCETIARLVRAYQPWPRAYTFYREKKLMICEAAAYSEEHFPQESPGTVVREIPGRGLLLAAGSGALLVRRLQLEAKREMDWRAFLNGNPEVIGSRLG